MPATLSDNEILSKVLQGEQQAFAELVARYQNYVFTLTLRMLKNREDAEEVAQDVFVKAYRFLGDFRGDSKFSTWLYTIAHTTCITFLRKKKRTYYSLDNETVLETPGDLNHWFTTYPAEQKSQAAMVNKALRMLSTDDAEVLTLFYKAEQNLEETGKILGLDPNTVKVRLHRARQRLKEKMEKYLPQEIKDIY